MLYQNILLIDDDPDDIDLLKVAIACIDNKKKCESAGNRTEALKALHSNQLPDIIILDLALPGVFGSELLGLIKNSSLTAKIPVVLYSSHSKELMEEIAKPFIADHYISKPNSFQQLVDSLKKIF